MNMISTSNYWKINGAYNICLYYVYRYVENRNRICISCRKPSSGVLFVQLSGYSKKSRFRNQPTVSSLLKIGSEKFAFCLDCNTNFLEDEFLRLNNILQQMTVSSEIPIAMAIKVRDRNTTIMERNNYYYRCKYIGNK
jgi:hypothetical protein